MKNFINDPELETDFSQYKTLEDFKMRLDELKGMQFSNCNLSEIKELLFDYLSIIPSQIGYFDPANFNTFPFYRARLNIESAKEDLNLISTYSYPPPVFCNSNGRANIKNKSVFYCSNFALAAVFETRPKIGDIGYLSKWKGNANRKMKAGIFLRQNLRKENEWSELADDIHKSTMEFYSTTSSKKSDFLFEAINFIADLYLNEKPNYPLTSCIANEMIYGEKWKDFIVYPSNINEAKSSNYAFHPNSVDRYLSFEKVFVFRVLSRVGDIFTLVTLRVGEIINTNMVWRAPLEQELNFSFFP